MMCGARRFGRSGKRIAGRQSGFLAGRVRRNFSKGAGFTLIELLVVISIITLLMAILLPTLQRVNRQAKAVACQANLKQWGTLFILYLEDYNGYFPGNRYDSIWIMSGRSFGLDKPNEPEGYHSIRTKGMLCPMAAKSGSGNYGGFGLHYIEVGVHLFDLNVSYGSTLCAWELIDPKPSMRFSYGVNTWLIGKEVTTYYDDHIYGEPRHTNIYSMRNTDGIPLLLDSATPYGNGSYNKPPPEYEDMRKGSMWPFCMNRHNGHINGLFLDWSVRKVGLKELWTLKWSSDFDTANVWTRAGGVHPEDWPEWMRGFKDY